MEFIFHDVYRASITAGIKLTPMEVHDDRFSAARVFSADKWMKYMKDFEGVYYSK